MTEAEIKAIGAILEARAWWPAVAGVLTLTLWAARRVAPEVWSRLPRRWQWVPPVAVAALAGVVDAAARGDGWRQALAAGVFAVFAVGLPAIGIYHSTRRIGATGSGGGPVDVEVDAVGVTVPDEPTPPTLRAV